MPTVMTLMVWVNENYWLLMCQQLKDTAQFHLLLLIVAYIQ